jgi:hypothetical protein
MAKIKQAGKPEWKGYGSPSREYYSHHPRYIEPKSMLKKLKDKIEAVSEMTKIIKGAGEQDKVPEWIIKRYDKNGNRRLDIDDWLMMRKKERIELMGIAIGLAALVTVSIELGISLW